MIRCGFLTIQPVQPQPVQPQPVQPQTFPQRPAPWQLISILTLGIVAVSTAAPLIRLALAGVDPTDRVSLSLGLAAARLAVAAIVLIPSWSGFRHAHYSAPALTYAGLAGVALALHFALWIPSLAFTSIAASTALVTTNPIWVLLILWIWQGHRPRKGQILGITVALLGAFGVGFGDVRNLATVFAGSHPLLGNTLALGGSWAASFYLVWSQQAQQQGLSLRHYVALAYTIAALSLLPFLLRSTLWHYPAPVYGYMGLLALFPQLIGHTSFNWALRWLSPTIVTLVILAEPIGSSLLGWWLFHEVPSPTLVWGGLVLFTGVVMTSKA